MCMCMLAVAAFVAVPPAMGEEPAQGPGGAVYGQEAPQPLVPGTEAQLLDSGLAAAPAAAPPAVQQAIWKANLIIGKPYRYGGGHGRFDDGGYDCSGTVSYALNGGGLPDQPLGSATLTRWAS